MVVETSELAPPAAPPDRSSPALFAYKASKDDTTIMELFGFAGEDGDVRVEAAIRPIRAHEASDPVRLSYGFPTREQAQRFADETVLAFEYLGCLVSDLAPPQP